jgi:hypothetical protein
VGGVTSSVGTVIAGDHNPGDLAASFASGFVGGYTSSLFGAATWYQESRFTDGNPFSYYAGQMVSGVLAEETSSYLKTGSLIVPWDPAFEAGIFLGAVGGGVGQGTQLAYPSASFRAMVIAAGVSQVPATACSTFWGCP